MWRYSLVGPIRIYFLVVSFQNIIFYSGFASRKEIFREFFNGKFAQNFFGLLNAIKN